MTPARYRPPPPSTSPPAGADAALGRPDLGVLAPGAKADMMAVSLDDPAFVPLLDDGMLIEHLVWSASSRLVTDVWVGGEQVVTAGGLPGDRRRAGPGRSRSSGRPPGRGRRLAGRSGSQSLSAWLAQRRRRSAASSAVRTLAEDAPGARPLGVVRARPLDAGARAVGRQRDVGQVVAHRESAQDAVGEVVAAGPRP